MKKILLSEIKSGSLIGKLEKVSVSILMNGEACEFDTNIKPFSYSTAIENMKAFEQEKEALAGIIASSLYDDEGEKIFTADEVRNSFSQALTNAVWMKILEVNGLGKKAKEENSNQIQNSSAKSESLQDEVLQKSES